MKHFSNQFDYYQNYFHFPSLKKFKKKKYILINKIFKFYNMIIFKKINYKYLNKIKIKTKIKNFKI